MAENEGRRKIYLNRKLYPEVQKNQDCMNNTKKNNQNCLSGMTAEQNLKDMPDKVLYCRCRHRL